jgi:hypothetical protein
LIPEKAQRKKDAGLSPNIGVTLKGDADSTKALRLASIKMIVLPII